MVPEGNHKKPGQVFLRMRVEEMLDLGRSLNDGDKDKFKELAASAGHTDPTKFLKVLEKAVAQKLQATNYVPAYSSNRYFMPPEQAFPVFDYGKLADELDDLIKHILRPYNAEVKWIEPSIPDELAEKFESITFRLYEYEKHKLVHALVTKKGKDVRTAVKSVEDTLRRRLAEKMRGNLPKELYELEQKVLSRLERWGMNAGNSISGLSDAENMWNQAWVRPTLGVIRAEQEGWRTPKRTLDAGPDEQ